MKGLAIIGSAQLGSHTHALSQYLQGQFEEHGVELEIFELAKNPIHQLDFAGTTQATEEIKNNVDLLQSKIDKGELGRGVGKGFYDYSNGAPYLEPDFLK